MSTIVQPRLPQELCDMAMDHLHDDRTTLAQCSLICKNWIASSSLHLFRHTLWPPCLKIWQFKESETEANIRHPACEGDVLTFSDFVAFLSATPRIGRAIESLGLSSLRHPPSGPREFEPLAPDVLHSLFDLLPRLRTLTLRDCRWRTDSGANPQISQISRSATVRVDNRLLQDRDHLSFLSCFRHINSLIINTQKDHPYPHPSAWSLVPVRVDFLVIGNCSQDYARVLLDAAFPLLIDMPSLRSISLSKPPGYYIEDSLRALTHLEHLDLTLFHVPRRALNVFPRLRSLTIRMNLCASAKHPWSYAWPALAGTLAQCAMAGVTTIGVGLHLRSFCPCGKASETGLSAEEIRVFLDSLDWKSLREAVMKYETLTTLRVMLITKEAVDLPSCLTPIRHIVAEQLEVLGKLAELEVVEGHEIGSNEYSDR